jgi:histidinol-phosphate aminotransferase
MKKIIKLSANENFYGCSPFVTKALEENLNNIYLYPDYHQHELKNKIAEVNAVSPSNIMLGVGVVGIIDALIRLLVEQDEEIITFERSFVAYGQLANLYNKKIHFAPLDNFTCNTNNIFPFLNDKTKLIFIANPNNPTGTIIGHQSLEKFLNEVSDDIYVVIDEAYLEYATEVCFPNTIQLLKKFPNLIILRGFSKIYGIAGLRIGYGIANEKTASFLENHRLPFSINSLSAIAAMAALNDQDFIKECVAKNATEREFLYKELKDAGYRVMPSQGNYLFMYFDSETEKDALHQKLADKGIIVCNLKVFGQDRSLRIGIPDREINKMIVSILKENISSV